MGTGAECRTDCPFSGAGRSGAARLWERAFLGADETVPIHKGQRKFLPVKGVNHLQQTRNREAESQNVSRGGQNLLRGASVLGASMIIVKLFGALFKIPLGNILDGDGMGYFSTLLFDFYDDLFLLDRRAAGCDREDGRGTVGPRQGQGISGGCGSCRSGCF